MTGLEINPIVALLAFLTILFVGGSIVAISLKYIVEIILNNRESVKIRTAEPINRGYINL